MSLHVLANHMSSKGRNGDSMLVHMTPHEVAGLQALAMKHGGSLTINPDTGLPEANFLKSLLPMIAGFALGPAGFGLMSAGMAGATVGAVTGLATGSLSKGLMAGLGAYGGAGLGASLIGAGEGALSSQISGEIARDKAAEIAAGKLGEEEVGKMVSQRLADTSMVNKLGAGLGAVTDSGAAAMNFAKQNMMPLAAAASPIMADMMVPTTTKSAPLQSPGRIREKIWDGRQFVDVGNTDANVYNTSGRNFSDLYRGYQDGGIVALADGGMPHYDGSAGSVVGGLSDQQLKALADFRNEVVPQSVAQEYVKSAALPTATAADFMGGAKQAGIADANLAYGLSTSGLSPAAQFALTHSDIGMKENTAETYGGIKGLSDNINYAIKNTPGLTKDAALAEMNKYGITDADVIRATGKSVNDLFAGPITEVANLAGGVGGVNAVVNPNGTITQQSAIPGATSIDPVTGKVVNNLQNVTGLKNLYTTGGGSLGYTSPVPESLEAFNKKYVTDRMSGDSLAAYEYLTGKKGAAYPIKSTVGQIARPYDEAVLGYPTRTNLPYIYNKTTGKMDVNPDYVAPRRDDKGNVTYSMSANDIKKVLADTPLSGQALYDWAIKNSVSAQQIADATGQSLSSVYAQFRAGSQAKADADKKKADDKTAADAANATQEVAGGGEAAGGLQQAYARGGISHPFYSKSTGKFSMGSPQVYADGGYAVGGGLGSLGSYSDGGRLLKGPGDGVSDSIPATIGAKGQPARLADGEFVVPARIVSELGNGSTEAGARKLYAMMDRVQRARGKTTGKNKVAANTRADQHLPA